MGEHDAVAPEGYISLAGADEVSDSNLYAALDAIEDYVDDVSNGQLSYLMGPDSVLVSYAKIGQETEGLKLLKGLM